ncbi:Uma2 family endonuclease [Pleurocapsales cyanobacterium LEGE 10410]|nr:Uma2 family endonuclease [Pleurocapsales cyanobacterium LEGE 10410]
MTQLKFVDLIERDNLQQKDKLFICSNTSWDEYEAILQQKANSSAYRISFSNGVLKIMSPSRNHEIIKDFVYLLIVAYCDAIELDYYPLGSTTLKQKDKSVGKEPDTSFCFNNLKQIPDLAVEVIFSSGSVEDLEKYQKLGVKEVWFWINNQLEIYVLVGDSYQKQNKSDNLANLDVKLLNKYINQVLTGNPRILKKAFLKEIS